MKTLIVDDSLLAEAALKAYFVKLGYNVVGLAKNGEIALDMIEKHEPEIVTVDYIMPGLSGVELVERINKRDRITGRNTKIFMISSDKIKEEERSRIKVDKYIIKPITLVKLREALSLEK